MIEDLRQNFKPDIVRVLFIGESPPAGGNFFYFENSHLYNCTKIAFDLVFGDDFNCDSFKALGCWLYDVCEIAVNHLADQARVIIIQQGLPNLIETVNRLKPDLIIAVKHGYFREMLLNPLSELGYEEGKNAYFLSFPTEGQQDIYVDQLTDVLRLNRECFAGSRELQGAVL